MKKLVTLALFTAFSAVASFSLQANEVFNKNCGACHAGGKNVMNPDKSLTMESLTKNGVDSVEAIKKLVAEGKAPMPAFGSSLSQADIDSVSAYVLEQAKNGWK